MVMVFIADILLAAGALSAAFYCFVLSRRLRRFTDLEKGVGGAIHRQMDLRFNLDRLKRQQSG